MPYTGDSLHSDAELTNEHLPAVRIGHFLVYRAISTQLFAFPATQSTFGTQASPAQPSAQTNPADKTAEDKKTAEEKEREIQRQEQSQRLLRALPNSQPPTGAIRLR